MPPSEPIRIFISYARRDGAQLAKRLQTDLAKEGFDAWLDTQRIAGGAVWSTEIEREIDTRQVTIALLSPGSYASEICRAEQLRALDKGNRVIPVLATKGADRPLYLYARQYRDFTEDANYGVRLGQLIADVRGDATATLPETYRKTRVTYLTAPPRVANYLDRPEALHALRDALFAEDHRQPIALTALAGMGGIGKTVLAKALTDDEVVQRAFPDGIVWITAGKERKQDFIAEMREVAKALGDDLSGYDNALACENQYRTTIANKAALIVVDDVWSKTDIEPLLAESPNLQLDYVRAQYPREDKEALDLIHGALRLSAHVIGKDPEQFPSQMVGRLLTYRGTAAIERFIDRVVAGAGAQWLRPLRPALHPPGTALIRTLEGHTDYVYDVAVSADGRLAVSASSDKTLKVWDVASGRELRTLEGHTDYVYGVAVSGDGRLAVSCSADRTLKVWELGSGRELRTLTSHADAVWAVSVTPDGQRAVSASGDNTLKVWDLASGRELRTLQGHAGRVAGVAVSADGRLGVSASHDKTLKVWDLESGRELRTLQGHADLVEGVEVSADGRLAVSASYDKTLKVWDVESGRELRTLQGHSDIVRVVAVSGDGSRAVSCSADRTLKVWDLESGREIRTLEGHSHDVLGVALSGSGRAVSASWDLTLKVWDVESGRELRTLEGHSDTVFGVGVNGDGRLAVSASEDKTLKVWDVDNGRELRALKGHSDWVHGVAVSEDGRLAVSSSFELKEAKAEYAKLQ